MGSSTSTLSPQTIQQLEVLMNDPIQGPKIKAMLQGQSGLGTLGSVSKAISGQTTPSGQAGAGIGAGIGLGIKALLNKNKNQYPNNDVTMQGRNPNSPGGESAARTVLGPPDDSLDGGGAADLSVDPSLAHGGKVHVYAKGGKVQIFNSTKPAPGNLATHPHKSGRRFAKGGEANQFDSTKAAPGDLATHPGKEKFSEGGEMEEPPKKKLRGVLVRRPLLSTTIVIAKKPPKAKAERKRTGGKIHAKKPNAIPPEHGPGNGDGAPAPFKKGGHVQSPRGSGIAQRGKRFQGIF